MSSTKPSDVDSRCYIFSYLIRSQDDLPADFPIPDSAKSFQLGVFLPRDDPDWFGRSHYPPRILLLHDGSLLVLTHPRYTEEPARFVLSDLAFYEVGHILLIGWLRFGTAGFEVHLPYNTRSERPLIEFLDSLMNVYLGHGAKVCDGGIADFGPPLDIKFRNHLTATVREHEILSARWFSPPSERLRRWGPFRVRSGVGGDLIAITNTRIIWIRDRWNDRYERYGSITSTAPLRGVESVRCRRIGENRDLTITLISGMSWHIPLSPRAYGEAEVFAESLTSDRPLHPKTSTDGDHQLKIQDPLYDQ
jgi:hypothetical protein